VAYASSSEVFSESTDRIEISSAEFWAKREGVMDLRQFFRKIRDVEAGIAEQFPLVASLETGDGGKSGVLSEVPRYQAARMIVEGKARLASEEEKQIYIEQEAAARKHFDELEAAKRAHLGFVGSPEPRPQQAPVRTPKK
jgi:hypothetical protein